MRLAFDAPSLERLQNRVFEVAANPGGLVRDEPVSNFVFEAYRGQSLDWLCSV